MPLDVDKISERAAKMAAEAATTVNDIAENAGPTLHRAADRIDGLAEKGRPYVERAEKELKDAVDSVMGRSKQQAAPEPPKQEESDED